MQQVREEAIAKLEAYSAESFPSYLSRLCQELASEASPSHIRKSAGLMLKNALSARQQGRKDELANRWVQTVDATVKESIKSSVLQTLGSADSSSGTVAAQVSGVLESCLVYLLHHFLLCHSSLIPTNCVPPLPLHR